MGDTGFNIERMYWVDDDATGGLIDLLGGIEDIDGRTRRKLLANGLQPGVPAVPAGPDPSCRWCGGTGRIKLLTSESDCDCVRKPASV